MFPLGFFDLNSGGKMTEVSRTIKARYDNGIANVKADKSGVAIKILNKDFKHSHEAIHDIRGGVWNINGQRLQRC